MKNVIIPLLFIIITAAQAQWTANYGGDDLSDLNLTNSRGVAITADGSGCSYVTGICNEGTNGNDIVVVKYDTNGDTVWARSYNGSSNDDDAGFGIAVDGSGNVYVVGTVLNTNTSYDLILLKYDSSGGLQWERTHSGTTNYSNDKGFGIAVDGSGYIYITGYSTEPDSYKDIVTRKYDSSGDLLWSVQEDGEEHMDSQGIALALDNSGNICITGFTGSSTGGVDIITLKYSSSGSRQWLDTYNGTGNSEDKAFGIAVDDNDNIFITGYATNSTVDCIVLSYDESGSLNWAQAYNGTGGGEDKAFGIAVDDIGNSYITGYSETSSNGDDYITMKLNSSGNVIWTSYYNGTGGGKDRASAIGIVLSTGATSHVVVTGESYGTNSNSDFATVRYNASNGEQVSVSRYSMTTESNDKASDIVIVPGSNTIIVTGFSEIIIEGHSPSSYMSTVSLGSISSELSGNMNNIPQKFSLYQNYPNPFNPATNIRFDLPSNSSVKLTVYDMLGKTVDVLINQDLQAGSYSLSYSNGSLASGIYFYELWAGNNREIKKMTLIK